MSDRTHNAAARLALIIDDTEVVRSLLTEALSDRGFEVATARNAGDGIAKATQLRPGLVFCDTYMPDMHGVDAVKRIREITPDAIVVMTNSLPDEGFERRNESGADYLLNKPFSLDELWDILAKIRVQLQERLPG
ncbi:MAG TPA: response regulator [candidate division Zixibacteria bacterium]|nr:response regulator [candidate division Zixibacteria bacterium]